ncbi:MAG: hypothetical protein GF331_14925 [Chitinivibrionales bacterium]|nr:hypothetical protein [Chitinivibrionales bacterium]
MRRTMRVHLASSVLLALLVSGASAIEGYMLWGYATWMSPQVPGLSEGTWIINLETGDTTRVNDQYMKTPVFSPDGREVAGFHPWQYIPIVKNDGTGGREGAGGDHFNMGWNERIAFTERGLYWLKTDGSFSFKHLMFADINTAEVTVAADLSSYGDAVRGVCMSNDGLRGVAWLNNETVTVSLEDDLLNPALRVMTGVWGDGVLLTPDGQTVVTDPMSESHDLGAGNPAYRTWVFYDWETGVQGDFVDRFQAGSSSNIRTMGYYAVRNNSDCFVYDTEDGSRYLVNWKTQETTPLPYPVGGAIGEAWLGALPDPYAPPALALDPTELSFTTVAGDTAPADIAVSNAGTGTLDDVTFTVESATASDWLTITHAGTGNAQTLTNTVTVATVTEGTYTATVTVSAVNCTQDATYSVSFTVAPALQPASDVQLAVAYNGADIAVSWTDNSASETGFIVERSVDGAAFAEAGRVGADVTSFDDPDLAAGTYEYRVIAFNDDVQADPSATVIETLSGSPRFAVTAPTSGETLYGGLDASVQWSSEIFTVADILLSTDGGTNWTTLSPAGGIDESHADWGDFTFTVPVVTSENAVLKVQDHADPTTMIEVTGLQIEPGTGVHAAAAAGARSLGVHLRGNNVVQLTGPADHRIEAAIFTLQGKRLASFRGRAGAAVALPNAANALMMSPVMVKLTDLHSGQTLIRRLAPVVSNAVLR